MVLLVLLIIHFCACLTSLTAYLASSTEKHLVPIQYWSDVTAQIVLLR